MKMFFGLLVVFCLALPQSGLAADLFVKKPAPATEAAPEIQPAPEAQPPVQAAPEAVPETINEFAGRYYQNCMEKQHPILKGENQQMLCSCSAKKLTEQMTIDDVRTMAADTAEGAFQRNRMLLQVYAPCMEFPTKALLYENCINGPDVKQKVQNYEMVCTCMAESMGRYVAKNAPSVIAKSLRDDPGDLSPLDNMMNSPEFQAEAQLELAGCLAAPSAGALPEAQTPAGQP